MPLTASKSTRLRSRFSGVYFDESVPDSAWIRETGTLALPAFDGVSSLAIVGELLPSTPGDATAAVAPGLAVDFDGRKVAVLPSETSGPFRLEFKPTARPKGTGHRLALRLTGVAGSNFLAWLGRLTAGWPLLGGLQAWRRQARNRRLRIQRIEADGEVLFDFSNRAAPWNSAFTRRRRRVGLNLVGYFRADLGIGESVRCAARSADAAGLAAALIDLKLPCKNTMTDGTFAARLQTDNPHPVSVFHLDPPLAHDLDHYHGAGFRRGKYNIAYWAWELPEFPDAWVHCAGYFDEVWAPSRFTAEAIAEKVPVPVLAMPHSISFERPARGDYRKKFGLPAGKYLFLFVYDLNSYSERKNPEAVIAAFSQSGLAGAGAALVIKLHNVAGNEADFQRLREVAAGLPDTVLITQTLPRSEIYELESACDCFVSLHRSEGFGLAIAESMFLGKPVISTNWSSTAEFVHEGNGCPVRCRLVKLDRHHGPYAKGQSWAEPDVEHAAWWMRRLHRDRALCASLGAAARATMEKYYAPAVIGERYRRRLEAIAEW
ncbi:MAG: glycosyltransferase [Opitutaceae bacterium]|nr:glycosyltransferase [Opitutaceae bacterium]